MFAILWLGQHSYFFLGLPWSITVTQRHLCCWCSGWLFMFSRRANRKVWPWVPGHLLRIGGYFSLPQGQGGDGRDASGFQGELKPRSWTHQVSLPQPISPFHLSPWLSCFIPLFWEIWQLGLTNFTLSNSHGWRTTWWLSQCKLRETYKRFCWISVGQLPIVKWSAIIMWVTVGVEWGGEGFCWKEQFSLLIQTKSNQTGGGGKIWSYPLPQKSFFRVHYSDVAIYPRWPFLKTHWN